MKPILAPALHYPRLWFVAGMIIATFITVMSLIPADDVPRIGMSDKVEHTIAYLALGFWFACIVARYDWFWLFCCLLAFGGAIEIAQGMMHVGRQADWRDFVADGLGIIIGFAIALTPLNRWTKLVERKLPHGHDAP